MTQKRKWAVSWATQIFITTYVEAESAEEARLIAVEDPPGDVMLTDQRYPDMDDWRIREDVSDAVRPRRGDERDEY
jgi:hypothetical protein